MPAPPQRNLIPGWLLIAALIGATMLSLFAPTEGVDSIPYSQFEKLLSDGKVARVTVSGDAIRGQVKEALPSGNTAFTTQRVPVDLAASLSQRGVEFSGAQGESTFARVLSWILPPLLFVGVWVMASRFMSGGMGGGLGGVLGAGRSKAKLVAETDIKVTFDDVAGVDEAKEELREIVEFLKRPKDFERLGAHIPRGILLVGPPGTGKTLLARAMAGQAGVPFFSTNGAEFVEMFVGVGAARVRDLFEQARKVAPCIFFIDELDALGRARGANPMSGGHDEKEQTLNQLLAEMDGFDRSVAVVILAATNRPEVLDPALLRAGRFDRQVLVDRPDKKGRIDILKIHLKRLTLAADVSLEEIAAQTPGFTGADLANLANEAAVLATRRGAEAIGNEDFSAAVERVIAGLEKRSRVLIPRERRTVAYHEMGHALVALALPGADPVTKVSIIPRGIAALGYTMQRPTEDRFLMGRQELEDRMTILMGGRAAEMLVNEDVSTGAADDLAKATDIARGMVLRFGMDAIQGPVAWDTDAGQFLGDQGAFWRPRRYSEATAHAIDDAVRGLLNGAQERALAILGDNRDMLEKGATDLLARESLDAKDIPRPRPVVRAPR